MKYVVKIDGGRTLMSNCGGVLSQSHNRIFKYGDQSINLCIETESSSERKSVKTRKIYFDILEKMSIDALRLQQEKFNKYNHIIKTISAQISQKVDGYFDGDKWYSNNYTTALDNIESRYLVNRDETRRLIHYFNKASIDLKNHIEGWEIIYIKDQYIPEFTEVSLKKAILNQFSSFSEEFDEANIILKFSGHFAEDYTVTVDKKLFSLIMYNFFSNALKYSMPGKEIWLNYNNESKNLDVSMYSVKMEKNELSKIFEDGVRGAHANSVSSSGNGLGLYALAKALKLMDLDNMYISPQYTKTENIGDIVYVENHFKFNFKQTHQDRTTKK